MRSAALALSLLALASAAQAHVTADPKAAPAGGFQVARFRVGHGCHDTAATTRLRIEMPPGLATARPQPKPGWALVIDHGAGGAVTAVTWSGKLPADQFDEFAVYLRLPATAGALYFPTVQTCGRDEEQWTEVPDPGEDGHALRHPAPALQITPAGAPDDSHHH